MTLAWIFLVDARDGGEEGRADLAHVRHDGVDRLREGGHEAGLEVIPVEGAREHVGQREEGQGHVLGPDLDGTVERVALADRVPVGQDDALGVTRGARGVDEGRRVLWGHLFGQAVVVRLVLTGADLHQALEGDHALALGEGDVRGLGGLGVAGVEDHEGLDRVELVQHPVALLPLVEVLHQEVASLAVVEDVGHLVGQVRLVDRDRDSAHAQDPEVRVGPLGAGVREDRRGLSRLEPELAQAEADLARSLEVVLPGPIAPGPVDLELDRDGVRHLLAALDEELGDGVGLGSGGGHGLDPRSVKRPLDGAGQ